MPERVRAFVNVEGFGLTDSDPHDAPQRYRQWLEQSQGQSAFMTYRDVGSLAARIVKRNPLLSAAEADFVARAWGRVLEDGRVELRADPRHKLPNPVLYRRAEAEACWAEITASVLLVIGGASEFPTGGVNSESVLIEGAGHMLHFDAPAQLAAAIESFLSKHL
jgi:pimeloyl-ACP methyl ester carboxylesterase